MKTKFPLNFPTQTKSYKNLMISNKYLTPSIQYVAKFHPC